jgi:hypothetical protein
MCKRRDSGQFSRLLSQDASAYLHDIAQEAGMLAAIAVVLFVIGFIVNAANVATPACSRRSASCWPGSYAWPFT